MSWPLVSRSPLILPDFAMRPTTKCQCCQDGRPTSRWRRLGSLVLPAVCLALMPKCPLCVAAYVAMFTGAGLSLWAASVLRLAAISLSMLWLGWLMARYAIRFHSARTTSKLT